MKQAMKKFKQQSIKQSIKQAMKLSLITFGLVSLLPLTACSTTANTTTEASALASYSDQRSFCEKITDAKLNACTAKHGVMKKQGRAQCYTCTITYSDAGKACTSSADCQGGCYNYGNPVQMNVPNQTGVCASNNIRFGCHQQIENGMAINGMLCID